MEFTPTQASALKELLSDVIQKCSPDEIILVEHCLDKPRAKDADGMLGIGINHEVILLLPPLLMVLKEFASTSAAEIAKHWGKELANWVIGDKPSNVDPAAFSQLGHVIRSRLEKQGFSSPEASSVTDSVIVAMMGKPNIVRKLVRN
jgi:hypothetical protein